MPARWTWRQKSGCMACHGMKNKIVGPGYNEIVARYQGQTDAESRLVAKVKAGGQASGARSRCRRTLTSGRGHHHAGQVDP